MRHLVIAPQRHDSSNDAIADGTSGASHDSDNVKKNALIETEAKYAQLDRLASSDKLW